MKQTLFKKYIYENYAFNITVILNSKESEKSYIHEITVSGKDYFISTECTSDFLEKTIEKIESDINEFIDSKLKISQEENVLLEQGFIRLSY